MPKREPKTHIGLAVHTPKAERQMRKKMLASDKIFLEMGPAKHSKELADGTFKTFKEWQKAKSQQVILPISKEHKQAREKTIKQLMTENKQIFFVETSEKTEEYSMQEDQARAKVIELVKSAKGEPQDYDKIMKLIVHQASLRSKFYKSHNQDRLKWFKKNKHLLSGKVFIESGAGHQELVKDLERIGIKTEKKYYGDADKALKDPLEQLTRHLASPKPDQDKTKELAAHTLMDYVKELEKENTHMSGTSKHLEEMIKEFDEGDGLHPALMRYRKSYMEWLK